MIDTCTGTFSHIPEDWDVGLHESFECESTEYDEPVRIPWDEIYLEDGTWDELQRVVSDVRVTVDGGTVTATASLSITGADLAGVWVCIDEVWDAEPVSVW